MFLACARDLSHEKRIDLRPPVIAQLVPGLFRTGELKAQDRGVGARRHLQGHHTDSLFARSDAVEESWRIVDPIINYWEAEKSPTLPVYPAGSNGPTEADDLLARDGRAWD